MTTDRLIQPQSDPDTLHLTEDGPSSSKTPNKPHIPLSNDVPLPQQSLIEQPNNTSLNYFNNPNDIPQIQTVDLINDKLGFRISEGLTFEDGNPNELQESLEREMLHPHDTEFLQNPEEQNPNYEYQFNDNDEQSQQIKIDTPMEIILNSMVKEGAYPFGCTSETIADENYPCADNPYCFMKYPQKEEILAVFKQLNINVLKDFLEFFICENEKYQTFLGPLLHLRFPQKQLAFKCPCVNNRFIHTKATIENNEQEKAEEMTNHKTLMIMQHFHGSEMKKSYVLDGFELLDHVFFELEEQVNRLVFEISRSLLKEQRILNLKLVYEEQEEMELCVPFGVPEIDGALLGGGIQIRKLTELYGPAGSGKTQLCLNMLVNSVFPKEMGGLGTTECYYLTSFPSISIVGRIDQIVRAKYDLFQQENKTKQTQNHEDLINSPPKRRRIEQQQPDIKEKEEFVESILSKIKINDYRSTPGTFPLYLANLFAFEDRFSQPNHMRLIVIDSIAPVFNSEAPRVERAMRMFSVTQYLKTLADEFGVAVVFVNQIVDVVKKNEFGFGSVLKFGGQQQSQIAPSLGLPWSNLMNQRFLVTKTSNSNAGMGTFADTLSGNSSSDPEREISVEFSSANPKVSARFHVVESGIAGVPGSSETLKNKKRRDQA